MKYDIDTMALNVIREWEAGGYGSDSLEEAELQCLIISALKEQDRNTRHACAEVALLCPEDMSTSDMKTTIHRNCINAIAV